MIGCSKDFTDMSGVITNPKYSLRGPQGYRCRWKLKPSSPKVKQIRITFDHFQLNTPTIKMCKLCPVKECK